MRHALRVFSRSVLRTTEQKVQLILVDRFRLFPVLKRKYLNDKILLSFSEF